MPTRVDSDYLMKPKLYEVKKIKNTAQHIADVEKSIIVINGKSDEASPARLYLLRNNKDGSPDLWTVNGKEVWPMVQVNINKVSQIQTFEVPAGIYSIAAIGTAKQFVRSTFFVWAQRPLKLKQAKCNI